MDFLNFLMALSPIVVVLVGILGFKKIRKNRLAHRPCLDAYPCLYLFQPRRSHVR